MYDYTDMKASQRASEVDKKKTKQVSRSLALFGDTYTRIDLQSIIPVWMCWKIKLE